MYFSHMLGQMAWSFEKHWAMLTLNIIRRNNSVTFSLMSFQYESIAKLLGTHITINPFMFFLHMGIQMSIVYSTKGTQSTFVWSVLFVLSHDVGSQIDKFTLTKSTLFWFFGWFKGTVYIFFMSIQGIFIDVNVGTLIADKFFLLMIFRRQTSVMLLIMLNINIWCIKCFSTTAAQDFGRRSFFTVF